MDRRGLSGQSVQVSINDHRQGSSWYNEGEIESTVQTVQSLVTEGIFSASEISVVAPFREHVYRLRSALRKATLSKVNVGVPENYQGSENRCTIISTVRARSRFLSMDASNGLGLIKERRRLCVSITRAKEALIIITSNAQLLVEADPHWRALLGFCLRHKLSASSALQDGRHISDESLGIRVRT